MLLFLILIYKFILLWCSARHLFVHVEGNWGITLADLASNMCAKKNWARVFSVLQRTHKFQAPLAKHLIPSHAIFNFICNVLACSQGLGKRDNLKLFDSIMTVKTLVVSLGSKRFQSSYWAKVRAGAKKIEGGRGGEKRRRLPANPRFWKAPFDISRFGSSVNWQLVKIEASIMNRLPDL